MCKSFRVVGSLWFVLAATLIACGGETPPPSSPQAKPAEPARAEEPKPEPEPSESSPESKSEEAKPTRKSPSAVIWTDDMVFMFSFADSDIKQAKEEQCAKKARGDEQKKAECMTKAHAEVEGDGIRFVKDDKGDTWYVVFRRERDKITELNRIKFTVAKEESDRITLSLTGPDRGKKPMAHVPPELVLEVPDDYSIALNDPKLGRMVYRGKVGILSETTTTKGGEKK